MKQQKFFSNKNLALLTISFGLLILGFKLLGTGPHDGVVSLTIAPIILVVVYLVAIPISLLIGGREQLEETKGD